MSPVVPASRLPWRQAWALVPALSLVVLLTWLAERLHNVPPGLAPYWLACGVAVGPAMRWPWRRVLPAVALAMVAGAGLGGLFDRESVALAAVAVAQCATVAWGLRRDMPRLLADRRPIYRVRLGHLARFIFALTLPASIVAGLGVAAVKLAAGASLPAALQIGAVHASASGLSIAVGVLVMWWDQLRAIPWRVAMAAMLGALAVALLAGADARLIWAAPAVAMVAGYYGSVWAAAVAVTGMAAGFFAQAERGQLPFFEGPEGFLVLLLVVWRLLSTGLLASLWSERRGTLQRPASSGRALPTPASASMHWRAIAPDAQQWLVVMVRGIVAPDHPASDAVAQLPAGTSLGCRVSLHRIAAMVRGSDLVVGLGGGRALLLLQLGDAPAPRPGDVVARCRTATQADVSAMWSAQLPAAAVAFLLASAAYLDAEPAETPGGEPAAGTSDRPVAFVTGTA